MECPYCKSPMVEELMEYALDLDETQLRLEDVPTWFCESCDATVVEDAVVTAVEDMLEHLDTFAESAAEEE